jgi:Cof subfamily protein (haloacid dehalogenase superfamily)
MLAIDLDGTLLSPAGLVAAATRAAVHRAVDSGLKVCFATGRNLTESLSILDAVGHYDLGVFAGGAMVIDTRRRQTVHRTTMSPALAEQVSRFLEERGHAVLALQDTGRAGVDYLLTDGPASKVSPATTQWLAITAAEVHRVASVADRPHEHTVRVGIVAAMDVARQVRDALIARFGSTIVTHTLNVAAYGVDVLEVFDPAVNKWEGILHVARHHRIDPASIIAIGDDVNDIPMVRQAGLGVAMGNAHPELLAVAGRIIGSNAENGLAAFINEILDAPSSAAPGSMGR